MKKMFILLAALVALALPHAAQAVTWEGFYVGGRGAANFVQSNKIDDVRLDYDTGYAVGATVGYRWCNGFRGEFEFTYRHNKLDKIKLDGVSFSARGRYREYAYMFNGYYDIPMCWWVNPYVGAGIGYGQQRFRFGTSDTGATYKRNGFAWQVIGGLAYPIDDCIDLALEYRFHKARQKKIYNHDVGVALRYYF